MIVLYRQSSCVWLNDPQIIHENDALDDDDDDNDDDEDVDDLVTAPLVTVPLVAVLLPCARGADNSLFNRSITLCCLVLIVCVATSKEGKGLCTW
jgi:hypothetical protein